MASLAITSTDPNLSFHLKKNPATGLTIKEMRQGVLSGWFPHMNPQKYCLWFKESSTENSFATDDGSVYLDLTKYSSTYFAFNAITTLCNSVLKVDDSQEEYFHQIELPLVQLRSEQTVHYLNQFLGLTINVEKLSSEDVNRLALYKMKISGNGKFNDFMMDFYLMFYLLHADLHQSDIVWMEGMTNKVIEIMKHRKVDYFLWYWFSKNILVNRNVFDKVRNKLGENSKDGSIVMQYGRTQLQRKAFIDSFMTFDKPILDVGCGSGDYLLPYAKKLKECYIVGVDVDDKLLQNIRVKLEDRKINNVRLLNTIEDEHSIIHESHDIILTEVIEHMPFDDAKELVITLLKRNFNKFIITTPNSDFNRYYKTLVGFRHHDHHFEFNENEFKSFITNCLNESGNVELKIKMYGVGDSVNGVHMAQAVVITRNEHGL